MPVLRSLLRTLGVSLHNRIALQLEILALRHQLQVLERSRPPRVRLTPADRLLWVWMSRVWRGWRTAVVIVKPETVIAWHRRGFPRFTRMEDAWPRSDAIKNGSSSPNVARSSFW